MKFLLFLLLVGVAVCVVVQPHKKRAETCRHFPSDEICPDGVQTSRVNWQPVQRPVLLIPGVGGSILFAKSDDDLTEHDAWPEYHGDAPPCDEEPALPNVFQYTATDDGTCLAARFLPLPHLNATTGELVGLSGQWTTSARTENYGLCGVDSLDPNLWVDESVGFYFRHLLQHFSCDLGYVEGDTLWAFPYDWRLGPYAIDTLVALEGRLRKIACRGADESSSCGTVDVITHSMGGLLFQELIQNDSAVHRLVNSWTAIGTPFKGAGKAANAFVQGYNFDAEHSLLNKTAHHLAMDWPASYALLPNQFASWETAPRVSVFANVSALPPGAFAVDSDAAGYFSFLRGVNAENHIAYTFSDGVVEFDNVFNERLFADAVAHQQRAANWKGILPFKVVLIAGIGLPTPHSFDYANARAQRNSDFMGGEPSQIEFVDGDGTVAQESAFAFSGFAMTWTISGLSHMDLVTSSRLNEILEFSVDVACLWSGKWVATDARLTEVQFPFDHPPSPPNSPNHFIDTARGLRMDMSADCMTITTNGTFNLNRYVGTDCSRGGVRACGSNGQQRCAYGVWTPCAESPATSPPVDCMSDTITAMLRCPNCASRTCECDVFVSELACLRDITPDPACGLLQQGIANVQKIVNDGNCDLTMPMSSAIVPGALSTTTTTPSDSVGPAPPSSTVFGWIGFNAKTFGVVCGIAGAAFVCCIVVVVVLVCRRRRSQRRVGGVDAAPLLTTTESTD
jgi:hypothetical protein